MPQDEAQAKALEELLDRLFDMARTELDTVFSDASSWTQAETPGCDLDSEY